MKGNKMRKKMMSYQKGGGLGGLASALSPVYGIMKGQGPFSKLASMLPKTNLIGVLAKERRDKARGIRAAEATPMEKMMAGGVVKRTRPIDGIATKGMTKGKIT